MTHPTTEPNIRERLHAEAKRYLLPQESDTNIWAALDAILAEMENPSEGMLESGERSTCGTADRQMDPIELTIWQAMIRHIRDGGK